MLQPASKKPKSYIMNGIKLVAFLLFHVIDYFIVNSQKFFIDCDADGMLPTA